jgi:hypothetical protein
MESRHNRYRKIAIAFFTRIMQTFQFTGYTQGIRLSQLLRINDAMKTISPERKQIAKIFKNHIEQAVEELGHGYDVTLLGKFDKTPIVIQIEITSKEEIP